MGKRKRREKKSKRDNAEGVEVDQAETGDAVLESRSIKSSEQKPAAEVSEGAQADDVEDDREATQSRKKRRRLKHAAKLPPQPSSVPKPSKNKQDPPQPPPPDPAPEQPVSDEATATPPAPAKNPSKPSRYILFVGNLPFNTTTSSIQRHFAALAPGFTVRHSTDKNTGKSRGFAFLEFENDALMRRCIKGYHHSMFYAEEIPEGEATASIPEDEIGPSSNAGGIHPSRLQRMSTTDRSVKKSRGGVARGRDKSKEGRKINIELTAGGGGKNSTVRKEKLKAKNEKLHRERVRIRETQMKIAERTEKRIERRNQSQGGRGGTGANAGVVAGTKRKLDADADRS